MPFFFAPYCSNLTLPYHCLVFCFLPSSCSVGLFPRYLLGSLLEATLVLVLISHHRHACILGTTRPTLCKEVRVSNGFHAARTSSKILSLLGFSNGNRRNNVTAPEPNPLATKPNQMLPFLHDTSLPVADRLHQAVSGNVPRTAYPPHVVDDMLGPVPAQEPAPQRQVDNIDVAGTDSQFK